MTTKNIFFTIVLIFFTISGTVYAGGKTDNPLYLPSTGKTGMDFETAGFKIIFTLDADLNLDGLQDLAAVLDRGSEEDAERLLLIAVGTPSGVYKKVIESSRALYKSNEGGVWGDPFDSLYFKNNSLFLSLYGGSAWRWSSVYQFKYYDSDWFLIGYEGTFFHTGSGESTETSYNFLSGKMQVKTTGPEGGKNEEWTDKGRKTLISLSDFSIYERDTYME